MVNKQFIAQNRPAEKPAADMSVSLSGLRLDNPVVPASGTFGYGNEFRDFYDINILGSFSFKGTTRDARFGNPTPRIAECTAGMINAVGLQNPGIDAVIAEELPRLKTFFHKPVIANISGFSVEEYAYCCERIDREPQGIGTHRGQRLVPQRAARRHVVRHVARVCRRGDARREGRDDQTRLHQALAQRHRHRRDRPRLRGGGCRRASA